MEFQNNSKSYEEIERITNAEIIWAKILKQGYKIIEEEK